MVAVVVRSSRFSRGSMVEVSSTTVEWTVEVRSSNDFRVVVDVVVVVGMAASVEKCVEESSVDSRWSSWVRCKMPMFPSMMTLLMIYPLPSRFVFL